MHDATIVRDAQAAADLYGIGHEVDSGSGDVRWLPILVVYRGDLRCG